VTNLEVPKWRMPEEMETIVRIFTHVLGAYMIPPEEIERQVKMIRAQDYGIMRGSIQEAHLMVLQGLDEDGMHTRAVAVREGAPAAGKTLEDLALRRQHGITVLAVRRDGKTIAGPAGDFQVEAGDRLVLVGTAERFAACAALFRGEPLQRMTRLPSGHRSSVSVIVVASSEPVRQIRPNRIIPPNMSRPFTEGAPYATMTLADSRPRRRRIRIAQVFATRML